MQHTRQKSRSQVKPPAPQRRSVPPGVCTTSPAEEDSSPVSSFMTSSPTATSPPADHFLLRFFGVAIVPDVSVAGVFRAKGETVAVLGGLLPRAGSRSGLVLETRVDRENGEGAVSGHADGGGILGVAEDARGAAPRAFSNPNPILRLRGIARWAAPSDSAPLPAMAPSLTALVVDVRRFLRFAGSLSF